MTDNPDKTTSILLEDFLSSEGDAHSAAFLTRLIDERVEPIVKMCIRNKLHVSLRSSDDRQTNQDALDLTSEVKTRIIAKLRKLESGASPAPIDDLDAYVRTVAANVCNKYLREKYPRRHSLKNQIRYLFNHEQDLSIWKSESDEWLCSLRGLEPASDTGVVDTELLINDLARKFEAEGISAEEISLRDMVRSVVDRAPAPLSFTDLVTCVYTLRRIQEPVMIADNDDAAGDWTRQDGDAFDRVYEVDVLRSLWREITLLPVRHRVALLLNLRDDDGEALVTLLPRLRISTISEIAGVLEFPASEFARIWSELPWDDRTIAAHLGSTPAQVANLRHWARVRLKHRLGRL